MNPRRPPSLLVTHVWSDRNKGDAAIVTVTLASLRAAAPDATLRLASEFDPQDRRLWTETGRIRRQAPDAEITGSLLPILPVVRRDDAAAPPRLRAALEISFHLVRSLGMLAVPSDRWCRNDAERAALRAFTSADLVISKGGGFLFGERRLRSTARLYRVLFPLFLARRLRRRYALLGQSIGPFATPGQRWLVRRALGGARIIGVRETVSGELARALGAPADRVRVVPDLALALPGAPAGEAPVRDLIDRLKTSPRPWIGLTVRAWHDETGEPGGLAAGLAGRQVETYLTAVGALCRHVRGRYGGTVVLWPQSLGPGVFEDDRRIGRELAARAGDGLVVIEDDVTPDILKTGYAGMDVFVATRLHSALMAMATGVPAIVIDYWGPKASGIMAQLGQDRFVAPYTGLEPDRLCRLFDTLWTDRTQVREHLLRIVPSLVADIGRAVHELVGSGDVQETHGDRTAGRSLSILLVDLNSAFGGVEQHVLDLSRGLVARGHGVVLAVPERSLLARLAQRLEGVVIREIPRSARSVLAVRGLITHGRPDVVHLHSPRASVLGRAAARLLPRRQRRTLAVVSSAHGWISSHVRLRTLVEAVYARTAAWEDGVIAVAAAVRAILETRGYPGPVWTVPNGLDPRWGQGVRPLPPRQGGPLRLGYFGRLAPEKGLSILIDALQRLRRRDWQLLIFGEGQTRVETERQIAASGLRDHIHLNGEVPPDAVAGLMAGCHAVVLPSLQEGCPYVVLEALSLGLPVVACAVGGVAELIADGKNGLLVPPADPDALAAAITRVIEDPELLDRCRREAGAHGAAYTADDMVEGVVAAYRDALATRRAAQGAT